MTTEDILLLDTPLLRQLTEENIGRDPNAVALDKRIAHAGLVATQVKYLQRARRKLPSYYEARAILPPLAFEQSSSEAAATRKSWRGDVCIDLTCGLGVDSFHLSRRFARVIAVERDAALARAAEINFRRLGADNITVVCTAAEEFLNKFAAADGRADLIYADPDRRSAAGRKLVLPEDCSPDILQLLPLLKQLSKRTAVKLSPLFDVAECFRLFGTGCSVEVFSLGGECKEVTVEMSDTDTEGSLGAAIAGRGRWSYPYPVSAPATTAGFAPPYRYTVIPDAALRRARLTARYAAEEMPQAFAVPGDSYLFTNTLPAGAIPGKVFEVERMERFDPSCLKRELRRRGIRSADLYTHGFPLAAPELARRLGIREGGSVRLAFTAVGPTLWVIELKEVIL